MEQRVEVLNAVVTIFSPSENGSEGAELILLLA